MVRMTLRLRTVAATALCSCLLAGCMANPGPPPVVEEEGQPVTVPDKSVVDGQSGGNVDPTGRPIRSTISVGVDPLSLGLNPHLQANNSELVMQIADLVLPSAFNNGRLNKDLLDSAEEVTPPKGVAQRVQYSISSAAQWSDGTPLTGTDFEYLWRSMISTAGVSQPAGYHAISAVTSTDGGRVVTVDFNTRVAQWQLLFDHLLPSHILQTDANGFVGALDSGIPASAGRYVLSGVDTARGLITLNRNDRFWGAQPANVDVLQLRTVRDTAQATTMLRSNQIGFADFTPQQTSSEALQLVPEVQAQTVNTTRQLRLHMSTMPNALSSEPLRRQFASLIDPALVARIATGRTDALRVGINPVTNNRAESSGDLSALKLRADETPVRIAVDPSDTQAFTAANTIVDVLNGSGVDAVVVQERMNAITSTLLPTGAVDAVIAWEETALTSFNMAKFYQCTAQTLVPADPSGAVANSGSGATESAGQTSASATGEAQAEGTVPSGGEGAGTTTQTTTYIDSGSPIESQENGDSTSTESTLPLAGDLSGYCPDNAEQTLNAVLSGEIEPRGALQQVRALNREQVLYVPLYDETRVHALGTGIVGPGPRVEQWSESLATAADWKISN
ncbi:putative monoacyl phosphatidylinositol tetramannoside-binding protein LpqW precursor [Corynebacterium endometrii]|uniref:Putative monoacyl phosphatidylinositol tetramannoside-binding protein LpqW n=2 Tax=Corynebacterium endometrii TaxID=2488819 RepID=A0A4P7QEQ6_9CORY|nr:putative monoacyl phosphatidylinositol tetramannoside-binding protein LpqW precursor [Corynebacterium endometrii]